LSTTMTSLTRSEGRSAMTRPMACASLWVGMMTDTRTEPRPSPPRCRGILLREDCIDSPRAASSAQRNPKRCENGNQQLPDPRRSPLGDPQAPEIEKCYERGGACEEADHQENA